MFHMFRRVKGGIASLILIFLGLAAISCLCAVFSLSIGFEGMQTFLRNYHVHVDFKGDVSDTVIQELYATIRTFPGVIAVQYVTPSQAYLLLQKAEPTTVAFLEKHKINNPLPHTFQITLESSEVVGTFRDFLASSQWKDAIQPSFFLADVGEDMHRTQFPYFVLSGIFGVILVLAVCMSILLFAETLARFSLDSGEVTFGQLAGVSLSTILMPFTIWFVFVLLCAFVGGYGVTLLLLYSWSIFDVVPLPFVKILGIFLVEVLIISLLGHFISVWLIGRSLQKTPLNVR